MANGSMGCPYCGGQVGPETTTCPGCHEDLAGLARLEYAPAIYFNEGLALAREGKLQDARVKLQMSIASNATFAPAHRLLAGVSAQEGRWEDARADVSRALALEPDNARTEELARAIESLANDAARAAQAGAISRPTKGADGVGEYHRDVTGAFVAGLGLVSLFGLILRWLRGHGDGGDAS